MILRRSWSADPALRSLFDSLSDALLLLDRRGHVSFANTAALRLLPVQADASIAEWSAALGEAAAQWIAQALTAHGASGPPPLAQLRDGRRARLGWQRVDAGHFSLRVQPDSDEAREPREVAAKQPAPLPAAFAGPLNMHWESPFPCTLQDAEFRFIDMNQAYLDFTGYTRAQLLGSDPIELQPEEDRLAHRALRQRLRENFHHGDVPALLEQRLLDAQGRERWVRAARHSLADPAGRVVYLVVIQDNTAEHVARERADRSALELDEWFVLSPVGMVLFDETGLLVRTNPAFEALTGAAPVLMSEASDSLRHLLAWEAGGSDGTGSPSALLQPGANPVVKQGWLPQADGGMRRLRASLRCYRTPAGQRRFMGVLEDLSMEEERDLAQLQIGALMDTAGVGLATFAEPSGWVSLRQAGSGEAAPTGAASAAMQSIRRDIVTPDSMPDYERLQDALRHATRAEVRYAIDHPELGQRWLLTRVEPATLASGQPTMSVVTLDITELHRSKLRSEQLLREMNTILESTTAGIAYLRGPLLVRCNRRFGAMLGLRHSALAGSTLNELLGHSPQAQRMAVDTAQALSRGALFETELELPAAAGSGRASQWYALSVRRTGPRTEPMEAIAVLSDVTRLKNQQVELELLARDRELMFSLSGVGMAFLRDGRIQRANEAFSLLTGYAPQALVALPVGLLFSSPAEHERYWRMEEVHLSDHGHWAGERQLRRQDGRLIWVQVSKRLVRAGDLSGGIIASYVNVHDRHRAEQAVALQAERTRVILDSVLVGIVTVGPRGIEWMNRSARRMFGGDLVDFLNQPISTVATPEPDHPFRQTQYLDELVEGLAETFECRVKARDGREFWVVGNAVATGRESTGRQLTYALLDIERRRQAEARTAEAQASLQRIIEAAPMAITLCDARSLRVLQANEVAARSVGKQVQQLIGRAPEEIFEPAAADRHRRDMQQALASSAVTQREYRFDAGAGMRVWDARYLPLAATGQPPDTLLLVATDVTEQRAAQEAKFDAAIAQRDMLVKEVHHRIKNNLQGVAGLLQQIAVRRPEVAPLMSEVVGQVQAIAQVYGLQVGVTGPLRAKSVVEAIAASVQRSFGRDIRFSVQGPSPHLWALPEAESIPIALTINELLTNAVKHCPAGDEGVVSCTLVCADAGVQIVIGNPGRLPEDFSLARFPGGVSGLGLVRALLPRRNASLTLEQHGQRVVATVALSPPGVSRLEPL
jgi:PAS domain S-box-containing protein